MNIGKSIPALLVISLLHLGVLAQPDTAKIASNALFFADSLIKADHFEKWSTYADLVPAGVIKHYGGKDGYVDYVLKHIVISEEEELAQAKAVRAAAKAAKTPARKAGPGK